MMGLLADTIAEQWDASILKLRKMMEDDLLLLDVSVILD